MSATRRFVGDLRSQSNYPAFRVMVRLIFVLGYLLAFAVLAAGFVGAANSAGPMALLVMPILAILIIGFTHLMAELIVMVADIADSALLMAEQFDANDSSEKHIERDRSANLNWDTPDRSKTS